MTAYLIGGKVGAWSSDGSQSVISNVPASGPPAVGLFGGDYRRGAKQAELYGYAHENVARVVLRLGNGTQYGAQTFAAWRGSGIRLWAFQVPVSAFGSQRGKAVLEGYDATGHVVWQMHLGGQGSSR